MNFYISGTGSAHPNKTVTNHDLAEFLQTDDEWIQSRTGIKTRRVISDETLMDLATQACVSALEDAKTAPEDIDLLLFVTTHGDFITPPMSCLLAERLGIKSPRMLDINMACSGFLYALDTADSYFAAGKADKALIVCAEAMSRLSDWTDRSTCVLFGDGAGAVVLSKGKGYLGGEYTVAGSHENLYIPGVEGNSPFKTGEPQKPYLHMDGHEIYIFAVSNIVKEITALLQRQGLSPDSPDFYLLHQANIRIIDSARKKLKQPTEKFPHNLEHYGNTSSASIPMLLDDLNRQGKLFSGARLILCSFGAGLTTGTCALEWNK